MRFIIQIFPQADTSLVILLVTHSCGFRFHWMTLHFTIPVTMETSQSTFSFFNVAGRCHKIVVFISTLFTNLGDLGRQNLPMQYK